MAVTRAGLLLLLLVPALRSQLVDLRCSSDVCEAWLSKNECPKLAEECLEKGRIFTFPVECGCCDYCIEYLEEDAWCDIGQPGQPTAGSVCGPGLGCRKVAGLEHAVCKRLDTTCHRAQDDYDLDKANGTLGHLRQRPACDEYGDFAAATCMPGSLCYCTSPEGKRIFGEVAFDSPDLQRTMTCMCSRDAWRASQLQLGLDAAFAHCMPDGSYDPLQCVDNKCTCVDKEAIPDTSRVHVALLNDTKPACFNRTLGHLPGVWARPCEAARADLLARWRDVATGGATVVMGDLPNCGLDGRYERLQAQHEILVCTDAEGEMIEEFMMDRYKPEAKAMNCNCARTRDTLRRAAEASGLSPKLPECCPNGNFKAWQCSRGLCYCVDINGNQLFQEVPQSEIATKLPCYSQNSCAVVTPHKK